MDSSFTVATMESESTLSTVASIVPAASFLDSCAVDLSVLASSGLCGSADALSAAEAGSTAGALSAVATLVAAFAGAACFSRGSTGADLIRLALTGATAGTAGSGLEPASWARPAAVAAANKAAPSIRVVAIRIVRLTFGRSAEGVTMALRPSKPLPKYGIFRSDQALWSREPGGKSRSSRHLRMGEGKNILGEQAERLDRRVPGLEVEAQNPGGRGGHAQDQILGIFAPVGE